MEPDRTPENYNPLIFRQGVSQLGDLAQFLLSLEATWSSRFPQHHSATRLAILVALKASAGEAARFREARPRLYLRLGWRPPTGGVGKPHRQRIEEAMEI